MASIQWTVQDGQWVVFFVFFSAPLQTGGREPIMLLPHETAAPHLLGCIDSCCGCYVM